MKEATARVKIDIERPGFMLTLARRRPAIDCKYNVNRDWDRTYATVKLLRENLNKLFRLLPK